MQGLILAAGRGMRCRPHTEDRPKLFVSVGGRTILDWQYEALRHHCDEIYVAVGHGLVSDGELIRDRWEEWTERYEVEPIVISDWDEVENGETVLQSVRHIRQRVPSSAWTTPTKDDVMIVCGDTVFHPRLVEGLMKSWYESISPHQTMSQSPFRQHRHSMVALTRDETDEETAGTVERGWLTDYGNLSGHRGTGIWIMNDEQWGSVERILSENPEYWFSVSFAEIPTRVHLTEEPIYEINHAENVTPEVPI